MLGVLRAGMLLVPLVVVIAGMGCGIDSQLTSGLGHDGGSDGRSDGASDGASSDDGSGNNDSPANPDACDNLGNFCGPTGGDNGGPVISCCTPALCGQAQLCVTACSAVNQSCQTNADCCFHTYCNTAAGQCACIADNAPCTMGQVCCTVGHLCRNSMDAGMICVHSD